MMQRFIGMPKVMLNGNIMATAMGRYKLGFAFVAVNRIAGGTAIWGTSR